MKNLTFDSSNYFTRRKLGGRWAADTIFDIDFLPSFFNDNDQDKTETSLGV